MKLPGKLKLILVSSFAMLYGAGTIYWLSSIFLKHPGEFGPEPHLLERIAGPAHVISAFAFLFVSGIIWAKHAEIAVARGKNRWSGWVFYGFLCILICTGVTILYAGESLMKLAGQVHPWFGQCLFLTLLIHGWHGWRVRRHRKPNSRLK